ncbi:hypothetical protein C6501_03530 [Candidatus Poribacteria bacterium]|nr:MAG: hypothetical protein C6501_03530 [Candidatus Poribacteria bacterium]
MKFRSVLTTIIALFFLCAFIQNAFAQDIPYTELTGHTEGVLSVAFSPDGQMLASGSSDDTIRLWNVETGTELRELTGHTSYVNSVAFSPDGQMLASGSWDETIRLWNVETGTELRKLTGHTNDVNSVAFSPDGQMLASGSWDETIRLWSVETGAELRKLTGHTEGVWSVAFSPDGQMLASGSDDDTIRLWGVETGRELRELIGHTERVRSVAFSPNGKTLASGSEDRTIRLWDVETGRGLRKLIGHTNNVNSVMFSPDGQMLASGSGSWDNTIRLWDISTLVDTYTEINVAPSSVVSPAVGEQFTVNINIVGGQDIRGYQLTLSYNSNTLRYVSHTHGGYLPGDIFEGPTVSSPGQQWAIEDVNRDGVVDIADLIWVNQGFTPQWSTPAHVTLNATSPAGAGNGDGTLATITFEVVAREASIFILSGFLSNSDGEKLPFIVQYGNVIEPPWDVNKDGVVNILDLSFVAARFGQNEETEADVNGDGVVDIQDMVIVASEMEAAAAAPSAYPQALEMFTATDVQQWITQAQQLNLADATSQRGILFLQQLLAALTPKKTALLPNYPNPFNPETWIPYQLAAPADVALTIYAIDGTVVRTLALGHQPIGNYHGKSRAAYWDGKNDVGESVASGVYFYTLTAGEFSGTRKMLIRK